MKVKCNMCGWEGEEEDLILIEVTISGVILAIEYPNGEVNRRLNNENEEKLDYFKACPNGCETDSYLMDIEENQ